MNGRHAAVVSVVLVLLCASHSALASTVAFSGLAYSGNADTIDARFKYSRRYEAAQKTKGMDVNAKLRQVLAGRQFPFELNTTQAIEAKGDEVLVTALVITSESVSIEQFGAYYKLFMQVRGQAMIFDFASKKVLRAYPLSFAYLDVSTHPPSDAELDERMAMTYEGAKDKQGILGRYADALAKATIPDSGTLFIQITGVKIAPDAAPAVAKELTAIPGGAETWLADHFGESLNSRSGVPIFPYIKGYAIGNVMAMRIANGDVFNLTFPKPDYEIAIEFTGVKKVKFSETGAGASYVYGTYAGVKIMDPVGNVTVMDAKFKNGETKVVPVTQTYVDDIPAYSDSIRGLFNKLSDELAGQDLPWLKTAAVTPDIDKQIVATRGVLKKCK